MPANQDTFEDSRLQIEKVFVQNFVVHAISLISVVLYQSCKKDCSPSLSHKLPHNF